MWKTINHIAGKSNTYNVGINKIKKSDNTVINEDSSISNEFNNFFIMWVKILRII